MAQEDTLVTRVVKRARIFGEAVSAIAKRHAKARLYAQRPVPVLLRLDEAPHGVDLIRKVREHLALAQVGQLTEAVMLNGAPEMQELLLQLGLFPRPDRGAVGVALFLPVGPRVSAKVFQKRGIGSGQ